MRYVRLIVQNAFLVVQTVACLAAFIALPIIWWIKLSEPPKDTNKIQTLTGEQAKTLIYGPINSYSPVSKGVLQLNKLTMLSEEAAKELAKHQGTLVLNGLTWLSDDAAKALSQHRGSLCLDGLTSPASNISWALSDAAAKAIAEHTGQLSLNGLTTLSDEAAKALAQHKGDLSLDGLTMLSAEAAKSLAQLKGDLSLDGLATLSDEAAKAIGLHKSGLSRLDHGGENLDERIQRAVRASAKRFGVREGRLSLNGLTTLSDEAARALAQYEGRLELNGLTTLSDEAARALRANFNIYLPDKFKQ